MRLLLQVQDAFQIPGRGLLVAPDIPYSPPRGFANFTESVTLVPPGGWPQEAQGHFSLIHLNPGGYKLVLSFQSLDQALLPVGTVVMVPEAVHARLRGADA
jgi:hypothetical protein